MSSRKLSHSSIFIAWSELFGRFDRLLRLYLSLFAWTIEILQYFNLVNILGLQKNKIMTIAIGSTFDWKDLLAYAIGTATILWLENIRKLGRFK